MYELCAYPAYWILDQFDFKNATIDKYGTSQ